MNNTRVQHEHHLPSLSPPPNKEAHFESSRGIVVLTIDTYLMQLMELKLINLKVCRENGNLVALNKSQAID
jgi:hypothetical protein